MNNTIVPSADGRDFTVLPVPPTRDQALLRATLIWRRMQTAPPALMPRLWELYWRAHWAARIQH